MQIEREWRQYPGWFASLEPSHQVQLFAMRRAELKLGEASPKKPSGPRTSPGPKPPPRRK